MVANVDSSDMESSSAMSRSEQVEYHYQRMRQLNNAASKRCRINHHRKFKTQEENQILLTAKNMELKSKVADLETQVAKFKADISNMMKKRTTKHVESYPEGASATSSTTSNPQNDLPNLNNQPLLDEGLILFKCPICRDKLRTSPQIHYGVSACFSCQAFFRRAHKNSKAPDFRCENDNKCQGTQRWKTRKKCQKCRLDICLKMGMKPEAVLTDDQLKNRFRKSSQKKSGFGGNRENYVESEADTELSNIDFDNISMSTQSNSGYSVDIKEETIETNMIKDFFVSNANFNLTRKLCLIYI